MFDVDLILNKESYKDVKIGRVTSVNPLQVVLFEGDNSINVYPTFNLFNLQINDKIVIQKIMNKYIGIAILKDFMSYDTMDLYPKFISKDSPNQNINNTTNFANLTGMVANFKAGGTYSIDVYLLCRNETSAIPNIKTDWEATGTIVNLTGRNCKGGLAISVSNLTGTVQRSSGGHGYSTAVFYNVDASTVSQFNWEHAVFTATTDASIQIRAAQATAHASNTIISSFSHIIVQKLY
jgi:hypothetical protein